MPSVLFVAKVLASTSDNDALGQTCSVCSQPGLTTRRVHQPPRTMSTSQTESAASVQSSHRSNKWRFTLKHHRLAAEALASTTGTQPVTEAQVPTPSPASAAAAPASLKSTEQDDISQEVMDDDDGSALEDADASSSDETFEEQLGNLFPCRTLTGVGRGKLPAQWVTTAVAARQLAVDKSLLELWASKGKIASIRATPRCITVHLGNVSYYMLRHLDARHRRHLLRAAEARLVENKTDASDSVSTESDAV